MNSRTGKIKSIQNNLIPNFPFLPKNRVNVVFTKHMTNLAAYLDREQLSMLYWLCYQSKADNTFKYSNSLLHMYSKFCNEINKTYVGKADKPHFDRLGIRRSLNSSRSAFMNLINAGYLINLSGGTFIINPMLIRYEPLSLKEYLSIMRDYQDVSSGEGMIDWALKYMIAVRKKM